MKEEGYSDDQIEKYFQRAGQSKLVKTLGKKAVDGTNGVMAAADVYDEPLMKDCKH